MAQQVGFAPPGTQEMTRTIAGVAGAGITGALEGIIVKMAPQMGAAAPLLSWGALLGIPLIGVAGALFAKGMIGDLLQGVADAGTAILSYTLPSMLVPQLFGQKPNPGPGGSRQLLGSGPGVKQLAAGAGSAPQRSQVAAQVGLEF
ncbi:hypothetical protein LCGC14_1058800 [marine sediment metagenome]|uniref:Uncharacterized protein n=1 Tax=marine sediment metagenome TaxID=412755 RepID=A0A0F9Q4L3_9ZZZZ